MFRSLALLMLFAPVALAQKKDKLEEYTSEEGRFKITIAGKPTVEKKDLTVAPKKTVPVVTERVEGPMKTVYAVTYADYPESFREVPSKKILDSVRDGLKGTDGKIASDVEIQVGPDNDKMLGRDVRIEAGRNAVRVRMFLVGSRLYQVMVTGSKDAVNTPATETFLKSFEVLK